MDHRYKVGGYVKLAKLWERSKDAAVAYHSSYYAEKFKTVCEKIRFQEPFLQSLSRCTISGRL